MNVHRLTSPKPFLKRCLYAHITFVLLNLLAGHCIFVLFHLIFDQTIEIMKNIILFTALLALMILPSTGNGQSRKVYTNPDFSSFVKNEQVLAILPFKVTLNLRPKERANMTDATLKEKENENGFSAQNAMETFLLKRNEHKKYTVSFQDINKTNSLLKKAGVTSDSLYEMDPVQICKILGVDGVISGKLVSSHPLSTGAAVAVDVLVGFGGKTNSGKCTIMIHDGPSGKLLWKYDKSISRGVGSDVTSIIDTIMKKASRKFPYNK